MNLSVRFGSALGFPALSPRAQDGLKLLAMLCMLIDHIGVVFFADLPVLRTIGRFAMPCFALMLGYNLARRGTPPMKYLAPLLLTGLVAQVPHFLLFGQPVANIMFSLALGVLMVAAIRRLETRPLLLGVALIVLTIASLYTEYSFATAWLVVFSERLVSRVDAGSLIGWVLLALTANFFMPFALVGLLPLVAVFALQPVTGGRFIRSRLFGYSFYPMHLTVLVLISALSR